MGKLSDALLNRKPLKGSFPNNGMAAVGQPVPVAQITEPRSDLSSGSDLNRASSAWPSTFVDGGAKFFTIGGWRKSVLREVTNKNVIGNYGSVTSDANFGFRWAAFANTIGLSGSGPIRDPERPTWQSLIPISWHLRVANPNTKTNTTAQKGPITVQTTPTTWEGPSPASLNRSGVTLL